ncbi:MAG: ABC transporter permease [Patescibacteria group bacterium]
MIIKHSLKTAFKGITTHKSRSALTILGIVVGVTAIILVMSLGEGAQNLILNQVQSIGAKTIAVVPGRQPKGPTDIIATFADSLKDRDLDLLQRKENVPHLEKIMPVVFGGETASREGETYRPNILGVTGLASKIYDIYPEEGRMFTDDEIRGNADVVVIGSRVKEELFGIDYALNQKIKIKDKNFKIIGLLPKKGQFSFLNFDEVALMPYTTAQRYIFGIKYFHRLVVEADTEENVPITVEDIKKTLRESHNITDPSKDDFFVETQAEALETVSTITNTLTMFLASVAAISLVVGGIGIMNIMLVSVTERTREIGLRKAIGATGRNILSQFLIEAIVLTASGGIIGITLGAGLAFLISMVLTRLVGLDWTFTFPVSAAILGLGVSTAVGLVFGLYPARQASLKDPIEALRYE